MSATAMIPRKSRNGFLTELVSGASSTGASATVATSPASGSVTTASAWTTGFGSAETGGATTVGAAGAAGGADGSAVARWTGGWAVRRGWRGGTELSIGMLGSNPRWKAGSNRGSMSDLLSLAIWGVLASVSSLCEGAVRKNAKAAAGTYELHRNVMHYATHEILSTRGDQYRAHRGHRHRRRQRSDYFQPVRGQGRFCDHAAHWHG